MRVNDFLDTYSYINEDGQELKDNMYVNVYDMSRNPIVESILIRDFFEDTVQFWDEFVVRGIEMLQDKNGGLPDIILYVEES